MFVTSLRPEYIWALVAVLASAFVSFFLSFSVGLFVLFFVIVGWWVWEHGQEGLLLIIMLAPVLPMFKITQTISLITVLKDVIILVLFIRFFLMPLLTGRLNSRRDFLFASLCALLVWTSVALLRADTLTLGILRTRDIVLYMLLYFAVLYMPWDIFSARRYTRWFLSSAGLVLLLALYQWFFAVDSTVLRYDPAARIWIPRLSSTLAHPSVFGQYLITISTLCSAGFLVSKSFRQRFFWAAVFIALLPFVYFTYSRAVWLGFVASVAVPAVLHLVRHLRLKGFTVMAWKRIAFGGALAVLVFLLVVRFTAVGVFVRSALDPTYASNVIRSDYAVRLFASMSTPEAFVGKGLGDVLAQQLRVVDLEAQDIASGSARDVQLAKDSTLVDNQHLKTFVEMGLVGLALYCWVYLKMASASYALIERHRLMGWWGIGFVTAFFVQGFFIDIWDIFPTNMAFWIVAALVSVDYDDSVS